MAHLVAKLLVLGFRRLLEALAVPVEQPAVIKAAQAAVLHPPVGQVGAAMRAELADESKLTVVGSEQDEIFAHDPDRHRRTAGRHLLRRCNRLPVAAQEFPARSSRPGLGQQVIVGLGQHCEASSLSLFLWPWIAILHSKFEQHNIPF
ncbi:MAG TPA: hypothetical protein VEW72_02045 [Burkholderiales bacterium]|nr:hypothetical protein [Burkholderiales bacterium]